MKPSWRPQARNLFLLTSWSWFHRHHPASCRQKTFLHVETGLGTLAVVDLDIIRFGFGMIPAPGYSCWYWLEILPCSIAANDVEWKQQKVRSSQTLESDSLNVCKWIEQFATILCECCMEAFSRCMLHTDFLKNHQHIAMPCPTSLVIIFIIIIIVIIDFIVLIGYLHFQPSPRKLRSGHVLQFLGTGWMHTPPDTQRYERQVKECEIRSLHAAAQMLSMHDCNIGWKLLHAKFRTPFEQSWAAPWLAPLAERSSTPPLW